MNTQVLRVAVVGHTNTGKTSLLRTLLRDSRFGEVAATPSTTRHVEGVRLLVDGEAVLELFDTPGLEDPIGLMERLDALQARAAARRDGVDRVKEFVAATAAGSRFDPEAKVLRQLLLSDAALYVIDARDPVLAKHRDELDLLGLCAIPVLPVLNFIRHPDSQDGAWREALARAGLHASVRFDTVAPERDAEPRLYRALDALLPGRGAGLNRLLEQRLRDAQLRHRAALRLIATLLVDVAATRVVAAPAAAAPAQAELAEITRRLEQNSIEALLDLFRFEADAIDAPALPLLEGRWQYDLFSPAALGQMGLRMGKGIAAGAVAGAGVDLAVGGLTLGTAAAVGALLGGGWQTLRHYGRRALGRYRGFHELRVDDALLGLLLARALHLLQSLEARGHAAVQPLRPEVRSAVAWPRGLPAALQLARVHPEWAPAGAPRRSEDREAAIDALIEALAAQFPFGQDRRDG